MSCRGLAWLLLFAMKASAAAIDSPGAHWWSVVVGVGEYPGLDTSLALEGPPNDVPLMVTWLARQHVPRQHITVLADQVAAADGLPTRAAILAALQALPEKMASGDIAFLYFAGHGAQQPQSGTQWSKADGLDEIFLPRDTGRFDARSGIVPGAISGGEIGRIVEALRARGIFVWLVFDSCHSATMARALMIPHVRARGVSSEQLGLTILPAAAEAKPWVKLQKTERSGGYVAFYGAQTRDIAPEMPLPAGELGNKVHGLFTYALLKALAASGGRSYREVAHRILAQYAVTYPATTPDFEGALDGAIGAPGKPLLPADVWPVRRERDGFRIDAGRLNGVTPGSLLALYSADASNTAPRGLLSVSRVTLTDAWAGEIRDPKTLKDWHVGVDRSETMASGVVRLLLNDVDTRVRIAGPAYCFDSLPAPNGCLGSVAAEHPTAEIASAQHLAASPGCLPQGAEVTTSVDGADLFLTVRDQRMYVAQTGMHSSGSVGILLNSPRATEDLRSILFRASRSVALLRLAQDYPDQSGVLAAELRTLGPKGGWHGVGSSDADAVPLGSELALQMQNVGPEDVDVTILALDDRFGITPLYPVDQESNLLRRGSARIEISAWARTPGDNRLVFIIETARAGRPHDLGYLAQPGVARHDQSTGLAGLLERIGFSPRGTRSGLPDSEQRASGIKVVQFNVSNGA